MPNQHIRTNKVYILQAFEVHKKDTARELATKMINAEQNLTDNEVIPGPYPIVKSNGIQIYHNAYFAEPPGVVTGRSGTIGKVFYIDDKFWAHNTSLYIKDFKGNNEKYIYYLILRMKFNQYYAGTTVPTLNRNDIHKVRIAIPKTVDEQTYIVKKIDSIQDILNNKNLKIKSKIS